MILTEFRASGCERVTFERKQKGSSVWKWKMVFRPTLREREEYFEIIENDTVIEISWDKP